MVAVITLVWYFFGGGLLPEYFARSAIEAKDDELVKVRGPLNASRISAARRRLRQFRQRFSDLVRLDRCQKKDLVAPDDRRRRTPAWYFDLPLDVRVFVPFQGRVGVGRHTVGAGATPLMPVLLPVTSKIVGQDAGRKERDTQNYTFS